MDHPAPDHPAPDHPGLDRPALDRPALDHPSRRPRAGALLVVVVALLAVLLPGTPAAAHTELLGTTPAKGATVTKAPAEVALKFSQSPNPDFTQIVVSDAGKRPVPVSRPSVAKGTAKVTFTTPPANGVYTVAYRIVSNDGHTVKGSYTFTVADPSRPAPASPAAPASSAAPAPSAASVGAAAAPVPAADATPQDDGGAPTGLLLGVGAVIVAAAGAAAYALRRKRRAA